MPHCHFFNCYFGGFSNGCPYRCSLTSAWWVMPVYNVKAWFCALNCAQKINATAAGRLDASEAWIHFTQQPNKLLWCEAHSRGSDVLAVFLCHNAGWLEANTEGLSHHDKKPNRGAFSELYFVFSPPFFLVCDHVSPLKCSLYLKDVWLRGLYVHLSVPSMKTRIIQHEAED